MFHRAQTRLRGPPRAMMTPHFCSAVWTSRMPSTSWGGYPRDLCEAICRGIAKQKRLDLSRKFTTFPMGEKKLKSLSLLCREASGNELNHSWPAKPEYQIGSYPSHWSDGMHDHDGHGLGTSVSNSEGEEKLVKELNVLMCQHGVAYAYDDVSNAALEPELVRQARTLEMKFFSDMGVYTRVPRSTMNGKIIKTRWIDINKGDSVRKKYRSRLVGKEFKTYADDSLYASTPPLEALRLIMSRAATDDGTVRELMVNDVARAYFHAKCTRDIYIELPEEDDMHGKGDLVGKLNLCLYGTRDAASNWQETLSSHLVDNEFTRGVGFPSVFRHDSKDIWTLVHGDDYLSCGPPDSLDWLEKTPTQQYEIKTTRVGHGQKASKEGQILNRVVRATDKGYEMEADPRHAELIIEQLDLTNAKGVSSPGTDEPSADIEEEPEPLETEQASAFRAIAARCNYLAADRPDIMHAVKELCREKSTPNSRSMDRLKRVGRYLVAKPRQIWRYDWQAPVYTVDINTDANWCGCKVGRKSTSGGGPRHRP